MDPLRVIRQLLRTTITVAAMVAVPYLPLPAQEHGEHGNGQDLVKMFSDDIATMGDKFLELAEAMSADQYAWQPMDSVRTVSQVFMLMAAEYYVIPSSWGAAPPEGIEVGPQLFGSLPQITAKTEVLRHLRASFEYYKKTVGELTDEDMHRTVQFFGQEQPLANVFVIMNGDMHEHLGQAIAYARSNHVVPPWTARARAN